MLRLTLELWPYGDKRAAKLLKEIRIINDGWHKNPVQYADYKVEVRENLGTTCPPKRKYITDYPRKDYDALYLTYLVLRKMVHEDQVPIDEKARLDKEASN
jgi:hypothetical protein